MKVRWELLALAVVLALYFAIRPFESKEEMYNEDVVLRAYQIGMQTGAARMYAACKPEEI